MSTERDKAQQFLNAVENLVEAGYARAMTVIDELKKQVDKVDAEREGNDVKPTPEQMIEDIAAGADSRGHDGDAFRRLNPDQYREGYAYQALYRRWSRLGKPNVNGEHKAPTANLLNNLDKLRRDLGL